MPPKETINSEDTVIYNFNTVWCGYSKRFQPIWDEFAASLNNTKIKAIDVKCDNPDNNELCGKFDVPGYPSIIIVKGGKPIPYQGNRTVNDLRKAVDLAPVANTGVTIYNFNTEWCGYSKKFQPIWDDFATTMKNTSINVVDVKCDDEKNKDLCNKYEVKGYPSVIIDKNGSIQEYNGPRTVDGLRAAVMDQSKKIHIYNFNTEWCGYSKQFQPIWNTFANSLKNTDNVEVLDVKCDDDKNKDLCKKFNIKGYPTVLILKDGKQKIYDGPRTVDGLKAAIFN
jgi:thiol-disulfide isomerase/thioredoxin